MVLLLLGKTIIHPWDLPFQSLEEPGCALEGAFQMLSGNVSDQRGPSRHFSRSVTVLVEGLGL